jgi:ubiquinone/menaquinone biosynthesis C-methylase UbiE
MRTDEDYQKSIFSQHVKKHGVFKGDEIAAVLPRIVKRYIIDDILDIGAGSGALIRFLKSKGFRAKGVDLYSTSDDIQQASITNLPFADESFNTVFCCDVIEHLANEQIDKGLGETARVLKKTGHLIITTPYNEDLELNSVVCPECGHEFHRFGHLQSFDEKKIAELLRNYGFKISFLKIYAMGAMAKIPMGRYIHFALKRLQFEFVGKTIVVVAQRV